MKYEVVWRPDAEEDLAAIWLASSYRAEVSAAAAWIDGQLSLAPLSLGESRESSVHRVVFEQPIGVDFDVIEDDKRVIVLGVFDMS